MADKPSRALVIYGEGLAGMVGKSHERLHALAALGVCGFLAVRSSAADSLSAAGGQPNENVKELSQLLDAYDSLNAPEKDFNEIDPGLQLQSRFMGMRAAFFSADSEVRSFAMKLGFRVSETLSVQSSITSELLALLGFSGGKVLDNNDFELVIYHVNDGVEFLDGLVTSVLALVRPESEIAARFHFSVVLSFDKDEAGKESSCLISPVMKDSDLSLLFPSQSYCMKGGKRLEDVRHHHPMLVTQWQEGVTRRDMAKEFTFEEFQKRGGNLAILVDRFLHELAFKLWKAPKYGA